MDPRLCVTVSAPTNIAVIKYWGKENTTLNTPLNSSCSLTLDQDDLRAMTSAMASKDFKEDMLILNNEEENVKENPRFLACMSQMKTLAQDKIDPKSSEIIVKKEEWKDYHIHVVSKNTFPTAAGLASSAAGYACLVFSLAKLFNAKEDFPGQFTTIARQGSGSACRSLYGGLVRWNQGTVGKWSSTISLDKEFKSMQDDSDAIQIADEMYWPELRAIILVVSDGKKDTSSTSGMKQSVETSPLLAYRAQHIVQKRLHALEEAFLQRDFQTFGELTMKDSNQFHATCLDTFPPIFYMNDTSRAIMRAIHAFNHHHGKIVAAYTFDAGPNAVVYSTSDYEEELTAFLFKYFPPMEEPNWQQHRRFLRQTYSERVWDLCQIIYDIKESGYTTKKEINPGLKDILANQAKIISPCFQQVQTIYATKIGGGPSLLDPLESLINPTTGWPLGWRLSNE